MLVEKVRKLALEQALWQPNTRILIAVSTGVDSMVLLDVMEQLKKTGVEIGVAHINHNFRIFPIRHNIFYRQCHM